MISQKQAQTLVDTFQQAKESGHLFPAYAACEVMVETGWGTSQSYLQGNNCFGEKQTHPPVFETVSLPTREYLHGEWVTINADFIKYPTIADSFRHRMQTLERLAPNYIEYANALCAQTGEAFVTEVCKKWSTDPSRAATVLAIYRAHKDLLQ